MSNRPRQQSARRQGGGRGRNDPRACRDRRRGRGCAQPVRRRARRCADHARPARGADRGRQGARGVSGPRPLAGIRVLDLTQFLAGPFATQILGDLGAEVIKLEAPSGDWSRSLPPHFVGPDSAYYLSVNRNKKSVVADLKSADGLALVKRLARRLRYRDGEFPPRRARPAGSGLPGARGGERKAHLVLDQRLRPGRPGSRPPRL